MPQSGDHEEMLEQVEAEFNYRKKIDAFWVAVIMVISIFFIGYHLVTAGIGIPEVYKHRAIHLGFLLGLTWLYFPARKFAPRPAERGRPRPLRRHRARHRAHHREPRRLPDAGRRHGPAGLHRRRHRHAPRARGDPAGGGRPDALDQHHLPRLHVGGPVHPRRLLPPRAFDPAHHPGDVRRRRRDLRHAARRLRHLPDHLHHPGGHPRQERPRQAVQRPGPGPGRPLLGRAGQGRGRQPAPSPAPSRAARPPTWRPPGPSPSP